jgi:hypothetical protein
MGRERVIDRLVRPDRDTIRVSRREGYRWLVKKPRINKPRRRRTIMTNERD